MARMSPITQKTKMKTYKERREEQRRFENDVFYKVWRGGCNPDRIDKDKVRDRFYCGHSAESVVSAEIRAQHAKPQKPSEEEYYNAMQLLADEEAQQDDPEQIKN